MFNNHANIITCALPYANGNLHLGHLFEATLADIKARHLKACGQDVIFISGDDCHGAATTLYCHQHQLDIASHLDRQYKAHQTTYRHLKIDFSSFSQTNTALHKQVVYWCLENIQRYEKTTGKSLLQTKEVLSWFEPIERVFLPDRYVKGLCPHCSTSGQSAEVCESCHKQILPTALLNPCNVQDGKTVELKATTHLVLNTQGFYQVLQEKSLLLHPSIKNKLLDDSLLSQQYIDISRDSPYYGILIAPEYYPSLKDQFFYVWFDAPIGYLTFAFDVWLSGQRPTKELFEKFLSQARLEHFIGKDIAYFHTYLWLNLLNIISAHQAQVSQLNFHGWLTINHEKLSKSKGDSLDISRLNSQEIDALRLYFFSKADGSITDTEFVPKEVHEIYNQVVVNGLANLYCRISRLWQINDIEVNLCFAEIPQAYQDLLDAGNFKKLHETLVLDLNAINASFQALALWKESCAHKVHQGCDDLIHQWLTIYQVLCLVCPNLNEGKEDISKGRFIHLASRLQPIEILR